MNSLPRPWPGIPGPVCRRDITLAGEAEDPGPVEGTGADDPVSGGLMHLRCRFRRVRLVDLGRDGAPDLALRLGDLREAVAVGGDPALGAAGGGRGTAHRHAEAGGSALVAQWYRPGLLRTQESLAVVGLHIGEQLAAETNTTAGGAADAVQVCQASPVEDGESVVTVAVEVERAEHESRATTAVVVLSRVGAGAGIV